MASLTTDARVSNAAAFARIQARLAGISEAKLKQAGNRTIVSVKRRMAPAAKRVVREIYAVEATALSNAFDVKQGSDAGGDFIALRATVRPISLIRFGGKWGGRKSAGAVAEILRGARKVYDHAFTATLANGAKQILARKLLANGKRTARLPLVALKGPSAYQMVQGIGGVNAKRLATELVTFAREEALRQIALLRKGKL